MFLYPNDILVVNEVDDIFAELNVAGRTRNLEKYITPVTDPLLELICPLGNSMPDKSVLQAIELIASQS